MHCPARPDSTRKRKTIRHATNAAALRAAGANGDLTSWLKAHLSRSSRGDYVALLGYIARDKATIDAQMTSSEVLDMSVLDDLADYGITLDDTNNNTI